jgi:hypothetical protein
VPQAGADNAFVDMATAALNTRRQRNIIEYRTELLRSLKANKFVQSNRG